VTAAEQITAGKDKLEQKVVDFEKIEESGLASGKWDVVFITLGTTKKDAGSAEQFEKIDREYVLRSAKEAKSSEISQRLVYLSSGGASSSSPFLYARSKGLTEEGLAKLGYSDTIIFRPGMLQGTAREHPRLAETVFGKVTSVLSHFSDSIEIQISALAKSMYFAGKLGSDGLPDSVGATKEDDAGGFGFTSINNAGAIALSKTEA